jgi:hypothetical protein
MLTTHPNSHRLETIPVAALVATIPLNAPTAEGVSGLMESWAESKLSFDIPLAIVCSTLMIS